MLRSVSLQHFALVAVATLGMNSAEIIVPFGRLEVPVPESAFEAGGPALTQREQTLAKCANVSNFVNWVFYRNILFFLISCFFCKFTII